MYTEKAHKNTVKRLRSWLSPVVSRSTGAMILCGALAALSACDRGADSRPGSLAKIKERGELVVLTRSAPTTVFQDQATYSGLEYDMVRSFADHLGVEVRLEFRDTVGQLLGDLAAGHADMAAAGLTRTEQREASFRFGPSYQNVQQQVVCHRNAVVPKRLEELPQAQLLILRGSSYEERLEELQEQLPDLTWTATDELGTEQILEKVWRQEAECTIADSNIIAVHRRYFPELVVSIPIGEALPLAWALPKDATQLQQALAEWFENPDTQTTLEVLQERYYGHIDIFDYLDTKTFQKRVQQRLPRYEKYFRRAEKEYDIPWTLLAAVAYQESHWNPQAVSPTGVRGIMMLTRPTAQYLGVEDRLNPEHSIMGGARYLASLRQRLPEEITEPDRTWIALAAYNVGMGHIRDARLLAQRQGRNPNLWQDIKAVLPLLQQKEHYKTLKHGYARGREAVRYVQAVRDYYDLLTQQLLLASRQ